MLLSQPSVWGRAQERGSGCGMLRGSVCSGFAPDSAPLPVMLEGFSTNAQKAPKHAATFHLSRRYPLPNESATSTFHTDLFYLNIMCLINLFHLLFVRVNNSNGEYKAPTQDLLLGPPSPGLIYKELLLLQMGPRDLNAGFPRVTETFVRTSLSAWAAFPWPVPHRCSCVNLSWYHQKSAAE